MIDREKVIKALKFCSSPEVVDTCVGKCPYAVADDDYRCADMKRDALALLEMEYINTTEEAHSIEVGEDGLPY